MLGLAQLPDPPGSEFVPRWGPLDIPWGHSVWPLARCLVEFTFGLLVYRGATNPGRLGRLSAHAAFGPAILGALLVALCIPRSDLAVVGLFCLLILVLSQPGKGVVQVLFATRPILFAGEISYAVYLLHWQLLRVRRLAEPQFRLHMPGAAATGLAIALFLVVLVVAATAAFLLIEKPGRVLVRRAERLFGPLETALIAKSEAIGEDRLRSPAA